MTLFVPSAVFMAAKKRRGESERAASKCDTGLLIISTTH
jgi:hypothetical protein